MSYRLTISAQGSQRRGAGTLVGNYMALHRAFEAGALTLIMQGGIHAPVMVTGLHGPYEPADMKLAGQPTTASGEAYALS